MSVTQSHGETVHEFDCYKYLLNKYIWVYCGRPLSAIHRNRVVWTVVVAGVARQDGGDITDNALGAGIVLTYHRSQRKSSTRICERHVPGQFIHCPLSVI